MAGASASELKEKANFKALSKRSKVALCAHGINKKFCVRCTEKKSKSESVREEK